MTWQGRRDKLPDHRRAVLSVQNVYDSDAVGRLPAGTKVKWVRIVQVIPQLFDQEFSLATVSQVSFATDSPGRMPLGDRAGRGRRQRLLRGAGGQGDLLPVAR